MLLKKRPDGVVMYIRPSIPFGNIKFGVVLCDKKYIVFWSKFYKGVFNLEKSFYKSLKVASLIMGEGSYE